MAEGFARTYGADVLRVASAGMMPASEIPELTHEVMLEKNIALNQHYPKAFHEIQERFDIIVNMSGMELPPDAGPVVETWNVRDPIGEDAEVYRAVRDEIEDRVMRLVLTLRLDANPRTAATRRRYPPKHI
jgi:protein-tyrosine-phosphatase